MEARAPLRPSLARLIGRSGPLRLAHLWSALTPAERRQAIQAAMESDPEVVAEVMRMLSSLPGHRPNAARQWPLPKVLDAASRLAFSEVALNSFIPSLHLSARSDMLTQFLDELGVEHERGVLTADLEGPPASPDALARAADRLTETFPLDEVVTYLLTLLIMESAAWEGLRPWLERQAGGAATG